MEPPRRARQRRLRLVEHRQLQRALSLRAGRIGRVPCRAGHELANDSTATNLGFNFTYAADIFPRKPWVLSAKIDCGTLGKAGLFTFRTTAGVEFHHIETYVGYEYTDIGREHWNALIAGSPFWF